MKLELKQEVLNLIRNKSMGLYQSTIQRELQSKGFSKTSIAMSIRELRKENIIGLYRKRWCLK